jgi:hypothetical protein
MTPPENQGLVGGGGGCKYIVSSTQCYQETRKGKQEREGEICQEGKDLREREGVKRAGRKERQERESRKNCRKGQMGNGRWEREGKNR